MRIAILGAGGVGGYLAHRLIGAGHRVSILARGRHLEAIRSQGLALETADGARHVVHPETAHDDPAALPPADLAVISVKGQDLERLVPRLGPVLGAEGVALSFLNGVEAPDLVAARWGAERSLIGIARISSHITAPGQVTMATPSASFVVGALDGRQDRAPVPEIRAVFAEAGIAVPEVSDVRTDLWRKFIVLTAFAAITAGARTEIGPALAQPALSTLLDRLVAETVAVAEARGVPLPHDIAETSGASLRALAPHMRASLAHDLAEGKPLEIDWLSGAVARLGAELGVATPAHATVAALLAPYRDGARPV